MSERFQATFYGLVLALCIGWIFYIGRSLTVPTVFSVLVVYVIVGLVRVLLRLPLVMPVLQLHLGCTLSALSIARNGQI